MYFFPWILLQLGIAWTCLIVITSRRGWILVRVSTMIVCYSDCCFQYQLMFSCIELIYCALTTNSPAEMTFPSIFVWKLLLVDINGLYVIFQLRWFQNTFKHNTLLFKCINWENIINHLSHYPWFNTPGGLVSFTFLQKTHIFFTKRR